MLERFVKERNGNFWKERLKSGTRLYFQECVLSWERILNQECVLNHLEMIERFDHLNPPLSALPHSMIMKGFGFKNKIFTNKIFSQCSVALKTWQYKYINTYILPILILRGSPFLIFSKPWRKGRWASCSN